MQTAAVSTTGNNNTLINHLKIIFSESNTLVYTEMVETLDSTTISSEAEEMTEPQQLLHVLLQKWSTIMKVREIAGKNAVKFKKYCELLSEIH